MFRGLQEQGLPPDFDLKPAETDSENASDMQDMPENAKLHRIPLGILKSL